MSHDVLDDADNRASNDERRLQSSHGSVDATEIKTKGMLSTGGVEAKRKESAADKVDRFTHELDEEDRRSKAARPADSSFQQAEVLKSQLDFEINRARLLLMRLQSLQRTVADAHFLAKKLMESDVTSQNLKDFAVSNLDKSVEKAKRVLSVNIKT